MVVDVVRRRARRPLVVLVVHNVDSSFVSSLMPRLRRRCRGVALNLLTRFRHPKEEMKEVHASNRAARKSNNCN